MFNNLKNFFSKLETKELQKTLVEPDPGHTVVLEPNFMEKEILDVNGVALTPEEVQDYWDDVFDGGIPMSAGYAKDYLWPKWGKRLGIPEIK